LSFDLPDGRHDLVVIATDGAGNASDASHRTVTVDATAPAPPVVAVKPGTSDAPKTVIEVSGEAGVSFHVYGTGIPERTGTFGSRPERVEALLPVDSYRVAAKATDAAGNTSPEAAADFAVAIDPPGPPGLRVTSKPGARTVTAAINGPVLGKAVVALRGEQLQEQAVDTDGTEKVVSFKASDGAYQLVARSIDFQGRESAETAADVIVDATAPALAVRASEKLAERGKLGIEVDAVAGSAVSVHVGDRSWSWTSAGTKVRKVVDLPAGEYQVRVEARDEYGNVTVRTAAAEVQMTPLELAAGLGLLAGFAAVIAWQRRRLWRMARWAGRTTAHTMSEFARRRRYKAFEAQRSVAAAEFTAATSAHISAHRRWDAKRATLSDQVATSASFRGNPGESLRWAFRLKKAERIFYVVDHATLVEPRKIRGIDVPTELDRGKVAITGCRVFFEGSAGNKEWAYAKYLSHRSSDTETTIRVTNRQRDAGFRYTASTGDDVAFYLRLALADHNEQVASLTAALEADLRVHTSSEPRPPRRPEILDAPNPHASVVVEAPKPEVNYAPVAGPAGATAGWWAPDSGGDFVQRWWDGEAWTTFVADNTGTVSESRLSAEELTRRS
jgi:hypothetical protein